MCPKFSHSISCVAPCLTTCTVHPAFCPLFHFPLLLFSLTGSGSRLITSGIHCADSRCLRGDGFMDPEPRTQEIKHSTEESQIQKLRIRAKNRYTTRWLYHITSHCCLGLKILLKALLRLKKQTWTTNKFVLCWLHHGTYRSEKQVRNDQKFITLKEKV